jgi:hypothetical protein
VILSNKNLSSILQKNFEHHFYRELKVKFSGWRCLESLDLTATISFCSLEVLQKVEFVSDENKKYRRGLLPSRYALSKLCRDLEQYGSEILPFEVTNSSIKFDIPRTVKWLFEQYGLWCYVANVEQVTMAAACDGGEFAWKLIQVSKGINLVEPRAVDPLTGSLFFKKRVAAIKCSLIMSVFHCKFI